MNGWEAIHTKNFQGVGLLALCLVCVFAWLLAGCSEQPQADGISNLRQVQTFGNGSQDSESFIIRAIQLASDQSEYLYVADQGRNGIMQFDLDGQHIQTMGSEGRGPGEFGIFNLDAVQGFIGTADYDNFRITLLSDAGELKQIFPINSAHMGEIALSEDRIVLGAPVTNRFQPVDSEEGDRFVVFDWEGDQLYTFGSFLKFDEQEEEIPAEMSRASIRIQNGRLHVAYSYFPLYRIYDIASGELLAEHNLDELTSIEGSEENMAVSSPMDLLNQNAAVRPIITGLAVAGDRIFVRRYDEELILFDELQLTGTDLNLMDQYRFVKATGGTQFLADFEFIPSRESFYMLEVAVEGGFRISEYRIMDQNLEE